MVWLYGKKNLTFLIYNFRINYILVGDSRNISSNLSIEYFLNNIYQYCNANPVRTGLNNIQNTEDTELREYRDLIILQNSSPFLLE